MVYCARFDLRLMRIWKNASRFGLDGFLVGLLFAILLAYFLPYPGTVDSPFFIDDIANYGISLIFFFYGLRLGFRKLRDGITNWRLHLFVQSVTYLIFPLIGLGLKPFFSGETGEILWLGIFFLCALPSTVSSSVVMVGIAGGNIPAAIFNASVSSLIGVFLTPLWMGLVFMGTHSAIALDVVISKLIVQVLLPLLLGMLLFSRLGNWAIKNSNPIRIYDQTIILLIVYCSFAQSFTDRLFEHMAFADLASLALGMTGLFFFIFFLSKRLGQAFGFNRADRITAIFCGSKKSMMQGALMANVMFAGTALAGVILLPIMIYHSLQLIFVGIIARKYTGL